MAINNKNKTFRHIQFPTNEDNKLTFSEALTYLALKSFDGKNGCFPSQKKLSEITKISIPTISKSIKSLAIKNLITITKNKRRNYYIFAPYSSFEPFSYEFLLDKCEEQLSPKEKAYIILAQQYMHKDMKGYGKISYSDKDLAIKLHTSIDTIQRTKKSLIDKGILTRLNNKSMNLETNCNTITDFYNLDKVGQAIIWKLKDHEDRLDAQSKITTALINNAKQTNQRLDSLEKMVRQLLKQQEQSNKNKATDSIITL